MRAGDVVAGERAGQGRQDQHGDMAGKRRGSLHEIQSF